MNNPYKFTLFVLVLVLVLVVPVACGEVVSKAVVVASIEESVAPPNDEFNGEGLRVVVNEVKVVTEWMEIFACDSATAIRLESLFGGVAYAHGYTDDTHLGEPMVQRVDGAATMAREYGRFAALENVRWCSVTVGVGPADFDARDVDLNQDMVGYSLSLVGAWTEADADDWQALSVRVTRRIESSIEFDEPVRFADLDRLVVRRDWSGILDGIDLRTAAGSELDAAVLRNMRSGLSIEVRPHTD